MNYELTPIQKKERMDKAERMYKLRRPMRPYTIGNNRYGFRKVNPKPANIWWDLLLVAVLLSVVVGLYYR